MTSGALQEPYVERASLHSSTASPPKCFSADLESWRIRKNILMEICWSCYLGNSISIFASRSSSSLSTERKVHQICGPLRVHGSFSQGQFSPWIEDEMKTMLLRCDIYHVQMQLDSYMGSINTMMSIFLLLQSLTLNWGQEL